jgi:hypothetical protein
VECIGILIQSILKYFYSTLELQDFFRRVENYRVMRWRW